MGFSLRWSEQELAAHQKRRAAPAEAPKPDKPTGPRYRSQLEAEYAGLLELRKRERLLTDYGYERLKLRLPGDVWYTPDFDALRADGAIELHECKGFMRESARNKLRQAVELYPGFEWFVVGASKVPQRLLKPSDVPMIGKGVR